MKKKRFVRMYIINDLKIHSFQFDTRAYAIYKLLQ